jgi:hypothetical protein
MQDGTWEEWQGLVERVMEVQLMEEPDFLIGI